MEFGGLFWTKSLFPEVLGWKGWGLTMKEPLVVPMGLCSVPHIVQSKDQTLMNPSQCWGQRPNALLWPGDVSVILMKEIKRQKITNDYFPLLSCLFEKQEFSMGIQEVNYITLRLWARYAKPALNVCVDKLQNPPYLKWKHFLFCFSS